MVKQFFSSFAPPSAELHIAACIVSVAMLLLFPATRFHNYGAHFRAPEVRRSIERQTAVAQGAHDGQESIVRSGPMPPFFTPPAPISKVFAPQNYESIPQVPFTRLLNRWKLDSSGSGGSDPLPKA